MTVQERPTRWAPAPNKKNKMFQRCRHKEAEAARRGRSKEGAGRAAGFKPANPISLKTSFSGPSSSLALAAERVRGEGLRF